MAQTFTVTYSFSKTGPCIFNRTDPQSAQISCEDILVAVSINGTSEVPFQSVQNDRLDRSEWFQDPL